MGDVGQNVREEIDLITRGGNYGWNYREGTIAGPRGSPPAGVTFAEPIWDTDRNTANSITGGLVYRGTRFAQLYGQYVFGDYAQNRVFAMTFPANGPVQVQQITTETAPAGFGADPGNGDILIASIASGAIRRLVYNSTATGTPLPANLTATGAFSSVANLTPAAGVVAYDPNVTFWSDFAKKRRWFSVPALADKITFAAEGNWTFPTGTVWVKHFDLELTRGDPATARRLETRFLVKTAGGVYGVTYKWNAAQTEATLVPEEGLTETITINDGGMNRPQVWRYPSRSECLQCHTPVGGLALSFNTPQLNRSETYASGVANQLTALSGAGYYTAAIPNPSTLRALASATDTSATVEYRVRSYLAANCVQCHQPGGAARGNWDARIETPTASAGLINGTLVNDAGDSANRVIVFGDAAHSMLLTRISTRAALKMPPLASSELDAADINLVASWISAVEAPVIMTQPTDQAGNVGDSVTFTAAASGIPPATYQWQKNGTNLAGATNSTLVLSNLQLADAATYRVIATNSSGSATSNGAVLTVRAKPSITTQPQSNAVFVGGSVTMVAAAGGAPTPGFQWQKNGINLPGATSATLTLNNIQLGDAGSYAFVATNSAGVATSRFARLVVLLPQPNAILYTATAYPTAATVNGNIGLDYLLTNVGTRNWGASHYLSIRDSNGNYVAFAPLIGANSGENRTVHLGFAAPATAGVYAYTVQALEGGVEFFNTQVTFTLTVLARQPNSITYNSTNFPIRATPGSNLIFNYNVTNAGTKNWGANHFLSLRDGASNFSQFASLNGVTAGASKTVNLNFTAPVLPGTYPYYVQALENGVEFFTAQANLTLTVLAAQPNAVVYTPTRVTDNVTPGVTVNLRYSLSNAGTATWGASHYASLRDGSGNYLSFVPISGITPGGRTSVAFSFVASTVPGTYTYSVQALEDGVEFFDSQDLVNLTVQATPISNAATYSATTFPISAARSATVNFSYSLTNRGTKTWGANHYLSLRDADNVFLSFQPLSGTAPGASKTVNLSLVAPSAPGIYTYRIQGMESGVEFFNMTDSLVLIVP